MPLKVQEGIDEPNLNLTPMIDIVFLLIIFFMVGTQFTQREREFDIKLPTATEAQPLTSLPDEIVVNVRQDGTIVVRGEERTVDELEGMLAEARTNYADQAVVLRGAGEGLYQHVMDVLSACRRAKIRNISLANRIAREDE